MLCWKPPHERLAYVIGIIKQRTKKTKKALAEALGISPSALTQLTTRKSTIPSERTLNALNEQFGVNANWLLNGSSDSTIEAFFSEEGWSNLREEIKFEKESGFDESYIICTANGWARVLDYINSSRGLENKINKQLVSKAKNWQGVGKFIRPLLGSPVFFDNYSKDDRYGQVYAQTIFYLQGTPPRGFIIASAKIKGSDLGNFTNYYDNRVLLECHQVFSAHWGLIPLKGKNCSYYIDLSHSEYLSIMTKQVPQSSVSEAIGG